MFFFFFFKQKTAYEMRISDWSSDVCSSDLIEFLCSCGHAGAPWFVRGTLAGGTNVHSRGLRWVALSCRPGAAFPSAGHPVLTRARAIHGALVAAPGRQDTARLAAGIGASAANKEAPTANRRCGVPTAGCGKQAKERKRAGWGKRVSERV